MIVATLASLSSREKLLEQTFRSLIGQVDAFCVYLNGYRRLPSFLNHPKVLHALLSHEFGIRGAEAKLMFWDRSVFKSAPEWSDDDIALTCDDDIVYPLDYVKQHVAALARHPGAITCVHGSILQVPFVRYADSRMIARMREPLDADARVHIPGTGTMAFRRGDFDINLRRDVRWSHCVDVMTALAAKAQGVQCYSIARPRLWLQALPLPAAGTGIFRTRTGVGNDFSETNFLNEHAPWDVLDIPPGFQPRKMSR